MQEAHHRQAYHLLLLCSLDLVKVILHDGCGDLQQSAGTKIKPQFASLTSLLSSPLPGVGGSRYLRVVRSAVFSAKFAVYRLSYQALHL